MKKIMSLTAAVLGLCVTISCQHENLQRDIPQEVVTFSIQTPADQPAVKSTIADGAEIADGTNVNAIHYAIYMTNDGFDNSLYGDGTTPVAQGYSQMDLVEINGKMVRTASIDFTLLQGQYYTALFWAQVSGQADGTNAHYTLGDLRTVSMTTGAVAEGDAAANDESRAAFYARYDFNTVEHKSHKVTLIRPFSQLNLLTTIESLTPTIEGQTSPSYTIDIKKSKVMVDRIATKFDTRKETAVPESIGAYTFALELTPEEQGQETLLVGTKKYHYVSMNYFFVPYDEVTDLEVDYQIVTDKGSLDNSVINVPIKKNRRTNLIGNLLTKETTFEIVVDSTFVAPSEDREIQ
jgi:hypothetical protein